MFSNTSRRSFLTSILPATALGILAPSLLSAIAKADQPHMRAALAALQTAKRELEEASADKGGHRVAAFKLVDQAISEVNAGIKYAQTH